MQKRRYVASDGSGGSATRRKGGQGQDQAGAPEHAPRCLYCRAPLDSNPAGRTRIFCDNKGRCKMAYHRKQQQEQKRADTLQEHTTLRDYWQQHNIRDGTPIFFLLQEILIQHGEKAAKAATLAVIHYAKQEQREEARKAGRPRPN